MVKAIYKFLPSEARHLNITNSNLAGVNNIYTCNSTDGYLQNVQLKATGCSYAGSIHAKQFNGKGNLKLLGDWFHNRRARIGDRGNQMDFSN